MCTLVAKKFPDIGWIGVKNRDRSASTHTKLSRTLKNGLEEVTLVDEQTHWSEGMNSNGIGIISSSLTPVVSGGVDHSSKNGFRIKDALSESSIEQVVRSLQKSKVSGCVMIFNKDELYLIEGKPGSHEQIIKKITSNSIVRTNHGLWIPTAGYQPNEKDPMLKLRYISSKSRLLIGNHIADIVDDPYEIMPLMAHTWIDNSQLTTLRTPLGDIQSRTTEQLMLIPNKMIMIVRNINGKLDFDQSTANDTSSKVIVGIDKK